MLKKIVLTILVTLFWSSTLYSQEESYKLLIFEGSDWCPNCIRFDKTVFKSTQFSEFISSNNINIEHIDFPQRKKLDAATKKYNASIADAYSFNGIFPTILLIDETTNTVIELPYSNQKPKEFIALIQSKILSN